MITKIEFGYYKSRRSIKLFVFEHTYINSSTTCELSKNIIVRKYIVWNSRYDYAKCYPSKAHALADAKQIFNAAKQFDFKKSLDKITVPNLKLEYIGDEIVEPK